MWDQLFCSAIVCHRCALRVWRGGVAEIGYDNSLKDHKFHWFEGQSICTRESGGIALKRELEEHSWSCVKIDKISIHSCNTLKLKIFMECAEQIQIKRRRTNTACFGVKRIHNNHAAISWIRDTHINEVTAAELICESQKQTYQSHSTLD